MKLPNQAVNSNPVSLSVSNPVGIEPAQLRRLIGPRPGLGLGGRFAPVLDYTCKGDGDGGKCTCGPDDTCTGMAEACGKLGSSILICTKDGAGKWSCDCTY